MDYPATRNHPLISNVFLEETLKQPIRSFTITRGSKPGDNYSSVMQAIEVHLAENTSKPLHLLIKTFPQHPTRQKALQENNFFFREYQVYTEYLPALAAFQADFTGSENVLRPAMPNFVAGAAIDYQSGLIE